MMRQRKLRVATRRYYFAALATVIAAAWSPVASATDLVTNGGFETGDFTGWTVVDPGNSPGPVPSIMIDDTNPFDGFYDAELGTESQTGSISQLLTTVPGTKYTISFELEDAGNPFVSTESFAVGFGSKTQSSFLPLPPSYNLETFTELADSVSTNLSFTEENDDADFYLDDVSVTPLSTSVPEPSSTVLLFTGIAALVARRRRRRSV